ncbi:MAG: hypothetical protein Kow00102_00370 [Spirochaetota bacterium]
MQKHLTPETILMIIKFQKSELTEHHIYNLLASHIKNHHNARILKKVAEDEKSIMSSGKATPIPMLNLIGGR